MKIDFTKMSGAGNDFIVIDNRQGLFSLTHEQVRAMCTRRTGIGADGLILVEASGTADFRMNYHNADGFPGSMCGNGGRCAVYFAWLIGIRPAGLRYAFDAGPDRYEAEVTGEEAVKLHMRPPSDFRERFQVGAWNCHFVNTGSPHAIAYVNDLDKIDVFTEGRAIRHREELFPGGANVNFLEVTAPDALSIRTFERGVEDETLACGTGTVAAALMSYRLGKVTTSPVRVTVRSGETLMVGFNDAMDDIYLEGPARVVYRGTITL
ncbi:diaminopimelate epimerase [Chlorobaculum limnaeum]|uniref:Diaminopimelate epimerase n=1 Tax=Chlorobaculum limnaeum TaxID=274537 RepID=A0A1D8D418_CHLLM|nr:diaminopimelate epimerase [Chlorobaculum limnaeum]AOS84585.1 diaminopimelate epimerase [Chlorobaculum limnaeum]